MAEVRTSTVAGVRHGDDAKAQNQVHGRTVSANTDVNHRHRTEIRSPRTLQRYRVVHGAERLLGTRGEKQALVQVDCQTLYGLSFVRVEKPTYQGCVGTAPRRRPVCTHSPKAVVSTRVASGAVGGTGVIPGRGSRVQSFRLPWSQRSTGVLSSLFTRPPGHRGGSGSPAQSFHHPPRAQRSTRVLSSPFDPPGEQRSGLRGIA